jgi:hypothetical protein
MSEFDDALETLKMHLTGQRVNEAGKSDNDYYRTVQNSDDAPRYADDYHEPFGRYTPPLDRAVDDMRSYLMPQVSNVSGKGDMRDRGGGGAGAPQSPGWGDYAAWGASYPIRYMFPYRASEIEGGPRGRGLGDFIPGEYGNDVNAAEMRVRDAHPAWAANEDRELNSAAEVPPGLGIGVSGPLGAVKGPGWGLSGFFGRFGRRAAPAAAEDISETGATRGLAGSIDDWQNEQWRQLENKDFHFSQIDPEKIGRAIDRQANPRSFLEYQHDKLINDINATEQQMRAAGKSPAEIADTLNKQFKMQATPEDVASGDNWWKTAKPIYKDDWTSKVPTIEDAQRIYNMKGGNAPVDSRVKWTPDRISDFKALADQGLSANQIAAELSRKYGEDISGKTAGVMASAKGIKTTGTGGAVPSVWLGERLNDFRGLADKEMSAPQIAEALSQKYGEDISPFAVKSAAQRNNIKLSSMKKWSPEEVEELRGLAAAGKSSFDAQMHFNEKYGLNLTRPSLRGAATSNGIRFTPGLAMDEASKAARAQQLGYSEQPFYRGDNGAPQNYDNSAFFSRDQQYVQGFASKAGVQEPREFRLNLQKTYSDHQPVTADMMQRIYQSAVEHDPQLAKRLAGEIDDISQNRGVDWFKEFAARNPNATVREDAPFLRQAIEKSARSEDIFKGAGFDAIDTGRDVRKLTGAGIRLKNAAFDPKKKDSTNIMWGLLGPGTLGTASYPSQDQH